MAAITTGRYREHLRAMRRQITIRSGDERAILLGWSTLMEHHLGRLADCAPVYATQVVPDTTMSEEARAAFKAANGREPGELIQVLAKPGMSEGDVELALDALDTALVRSGRHLDDIMNSKAPPHFSAADLEKAKVRYAAIVADAPWALPTLVKPKGQWGGKRS